MLVRGLKAAEYHSYPATKSGWNICSVGDGVVNSGTATAPGGIDHGLTLSWARVSIEDTGWVGHGCWNTAFAGVGGTGTSAYGMSGSPLARSRMNVNPAFVVPSTAGTPFQLNSMIGCAQSKSHRSW